MILYVVRNPQPDHTPGEMYVDGEWFGYTLEDPVRTGPKVYGQTAIPAGRYRVRLSESKNFKGKVLPEILDVPGFTGVRIHGGNDVGDTLGCILVGAKRSGKKISDRLTDQLIAKIREVWPHEPVYIEIVNKPTAK